MTKERSIRFNADEVLATLAGNKTQFRRVMNPQPPHSCHYVINDNRTAACCFGDQSTKSSLWCVPPTPTSRDHLLPCPYGKPGDLLWVKETFRIYDKFHECPCYDECQCPPSGTTLYRADHPFYEAHWTPSVHMPRERSRILLRVTDVREERVQDISEEEVADEGVEPHVVGDNEDDWFTPFRTLWDSINEPRGFGWDLNPWVWVVGLEHAT